MGSHINFDYKSDSDFPSLNNVSNVNSKRPNSPPEQATGYDSSKENRENRSMSRGRGKKQNWKTLQVEFSNSHGQRFPQRGTGRNRFGVNHVKPMDEGTENAYRANRNGGRSRSRRTRGGVQYQGRPHNEEPLSNPQESTSKLEPNPTIMPIIPYKANYGNVQPIVAQPTDEEGDLTKAIRLQVEYYFSEGNLRKDPYMCENMTEDGFLPIIFIASFRKLKKLTTNLQKIIEAIEGSDKLEVVDKKSVRPIVNPLFWPQKYSGYKDRLEPVNAVPLEPSAPSLRVDVPEFVPGVPVDNVVFQSSQAAVNNSSASDLITNIMGNLTLNTDAYVAYEQCYPSDSQDVNNYQRMFTYVSS